MLPALPGPNKPTPDKPGGLALPSLPTPVFGGYVPSLPKTPDPATPAQAPLPFLAKAVDAFGRPYYGDGFQGWARRTYATLYDPKNFDYNDPAIQAQWATVKSSTQQAIEKNFAWKSWGEKIFGITSRELAEGITAQKGELAKAEMAGESVAGTETAQVTGALKKLPGIAWNTFTTVLGTTDWLSRKAYSFRLGLHDAKLSAWTETQPQSEIAEVFDKASLLVPVSGFGDAVNIARGIIAGRITYGEVKDIIHNDMAGSAMLYTMLIDDARKAEFIARYKAGENPALLAEELQNPVAELVGSILGDPLTWEGAGIPGNFGRAQTAIKVFGREIKIGNITLKVPWEVVGRLPTFGDALATVGIKVGKARLVDEVAKFIEPAPEIKKAIAGWADVANQNTIVRAADEMAAFIQKDAKTYKLTSLDQASKASVIGRDASNVLRNVIANTSSAEESYQIFGYYGKLFTGTLEEQRVAAAALASHPMANILLSEKGLQTGNFLSKLTEVGADATRPRLLDIIDAAKGDKLKMAEQLFKRYDDVLHETFASVDEMYNATKKVRAAATTGAALDEKTIQLAERYKTLAQEQPWVTAARNVTRQIDRIHQPAVGAMGNVYISWNPAFYAKNIWGQSLGIITEFGLAEGAEITAKVATQSVFAKQAEKLLAENTAASTDLLGYVHEGISRGFNKVLGLTEKSAAARAEQMTSGEIVVRTLKNEIQKALRSGVIPEVELSNLERVMPGAKDLMINLLKKNDGNSVKAITELREVLATGYIDAQRFVPLDPTLRQFLSDNHLLEQVYNIQKKAKTQEEFSARINEMVTKLSKKTLQSLLSVPASVGEAVAKETPELAEASMDAQKLYHEGVLPYDTADSFTRVVQAEQNARQALSKASDAALVELGNRIPDPTMRSALANEVTAQQAIFDQAYQNMNSVRTKVLAMYKDKVLSTAEKWREVAVGDLFSMSKLFPDVDPATLSKSQFDNLLWKSYFSWAGEHWHAANNDLFDGKMTVFERYATAAGTDIKTLFASQADQLNLFEQAYKSRQTAERYQQEFLATRKAVEAATGAGVSLQDAEVPADFKGGKQHLFNAVNVDRTAAGLPPRATMAEVTQAEWEAALGKRMPAAKPIAEAAEKLPPPYNGEQPTYAMALYQNMEGFQKDIGKWSEMVTQAWGHSVPVNDFTPEAENLLGEFKGAYETRAVEMRTRAAAMATAKRDFLLHSYDKTYLDHALAYLMPFHYWTDRTYLRWMERLLENPGLATNYAKYRNYAEESHSSLPSWWKYNVQVPNLLGMGTDTPLFVNLEASLNPLNGITGVDFNDPYKRVDWLSRSVDDLNQFGPSFSPVISWVVGLELMQKNEIDAGQRWFGRLFPQTAPIKAGLQLAENAIGKVTGEQPGMLDFGPLVKNNELDPFVNLLEGGLDPYERGRVGRALSMLQMQGVPEEQLLDAARTQTGPLWEQAIQLATTIRAPGQLFAAAFGVGMKPRTQGDMQIDQFYSELSHLYALGSTTSPSDYKAGWDALREKYPFMDVLLLSKRGGPERDSAYAYNVLGRIPPGSSREVLALVGLTQDQIDLFYDSKGFKEGADWSENDRARFMAGILDLGAILALPDQPTRQEWNAAKSSYKTIETVINQTFGEEIQQTLTTYYDLLDANSSQASEFKDSHPEIAQALQLKQQIILTTPMLSKYYASIDTIENYWDGQVRTTLQGKYGRDITEKWQEYYNLQQQDALNKQLGHPSHLARDFYRQHPELKAYSADKKVLDQQANEAIVNMAAKLPRGPEISIRPDFQAEGVTQEGLQQALGEPQTPPWEELRQIMPDPLQRLVVNYWQSGRPLPGAATNELDYLAGRYGFGSGKDLLRLAGLSLRQGQSFSGLPPLPSP